MVKLILGAIAGFFGGAALTKRYKKKVEKIEAGTKNSVMKKLVVDGRRSLLIAHTLVRMQLSRAFLSTARYSALNSLCLGGVFRALRRSLAGSIELLNISLFEPTTLLDTALSAGDMRPCLSLSPTQFWAHTYLSWVQLLGCVISLCPEAQLSSSWWGSASSLCACLLCSLLIQRSTQM